MRPALSTIGASMIADSRAPSRVADMASSRRSGRSIACASRQSASARSASSERSWISSRMTVGNASPAPDRRAGGEPSRPVVTTSMRVADETALSSRVRKPTVRPDRLADQAGHAAGGGAGGKPARFEHQDAARDPWARHRAAPAARWSSCPRRAGRRARRWARRPSTVSRRGRHSVMGRSGIVKSGRGMILSLYGYGGASPKALLHLLYWQRLRWPLRRAQE